MNYFVIAVMKWISPAIMSAMLLMPHKRSEGMEREKRWPVLSMTFSVADMRSTKMRLLETCWRVDTP